MTPTTVWTEKEGLAPGTLLYTGERYLDSTSISWVEYTVETIKTQTFTDNQPLPELNPNVLTWVHIEGLHDVDLIKTIGDRFSLHPMMMEDILNTGQRPKIEDYDTWLFMVMRLLHLPEDSRIITSNQVSILVGDTVVISFSETRCDPFDAVLKRLQGIRKRIGAFGAGYMGLCIDRHPDRPFHHHSGNHEPRTGSHAGRDGGAPVRRTFTVIEFIQEECRYITKTCRSQPRSHPAVSVVWA